MAHSAPAKRILTVCLGNHCRSPFAAAVLTRLGGAAVEVRSAGLCGKWAGQAAHPAMVAAADRRGYDLTGHRGVQVTPDLLDWADAILAMDDATLAALCDLGGERAAPKLALYLSDQDVHDPWGQDEAVFAACAQVIEAGAARHLR